MRKFYIHKDDQQQGPFSLGELKDLKITKDTMVWFEGSENWKKAIEVEDLKEIFKGVPPPMWTNPSVIPPSIIEKNPKGVSNTRIEAGSTKKYTILIIVVVAILLVGGFVAMQQQLEEQKIKIQGQEEIESARLEEEQNQKRAAEAAQRQAELDSLNYQYDQAVTNLRAAKIRLTEIQQYQLLRTNSEKHDQVQVQLELIRSWENEVERLKNEIEKY